MKKWCILILLLGCGHLQAQRLSDLINQGAKEKKALLEQIAGLKVYISYLEKGYSIAKNGLDDMNNLKRGELNLHTNYYNSLKTVSAAVKNYDKVQATTDLQRFILQESRSVEDLTTSSAAFNSSEISYVKGVMDRLLGDCNKALAELISVTSDGQLTMKDDERIKRVDHLYMEMQDRYAFVRDFDNQVHVLAIERKQEEGDIRALKGLYGQSK